MRQLFAGLSFAAGTALCASAADIAPKVERPEGAYSSAWLVLEKAAPGGADLSHRMWLDESTVAAGGSSLKGELRGRAVLGADRGGAAPGTTGDFVFTLEARVEGKSVAGSFTAKLSGAESTEGKFPDAPSGS